MVTRCFRRAGGEPVLPHELAHRAPDVGRVSRRFYEQFLREHARFRACITGLSAQAEREEYAAALFNRLMFVYFLQRKGFLDGDRDYLRNRLNRWRAEHDQDGGDSFYRGFLVRLFHDGLGRRERTPELETLLGCIPCLASGLFDLLELERPARAGWAIQIPDAAFERIFDFFDHYDWCLEERPPLGDNQVTLQVFGSIVEPSVNRKQMGAYYTKADVAAYIAANTVIPCLLDAVRAQCPIAFEHPDGPTVWDLLRANPDRYIYPAVRHGVTWACQPGHQGVPLEQPYVLPTAIAIGLDPPTRQRPVAEAGSIDDIATARLRKGWNAPAPPEYALPTETWREVVARRRRYAQLKANLAAGEVRAVNDLITLNLDIRRFAQDVIEQVEVVGARHAADLLRAFWHALTRIAILDPTCGAGAFLCAALDILEPLYDACLDRMAALVEGCNHAGAEYDPAPCADFHTVLAAAAVYPNRRAFIITSIICNNLYGVDLLEAAVEICRLRLVLKLLAHVEPDAQRPNKGLVPLPGMDCNIRAGNALVGYASYDDVRRALARTLDDKMLKRIERQVAGLQRACDAFQARHVQPSNSLSSAQSHELCRRRAALAAALNRSLAGEYGVELAAQAGRSRERSAVQAISAAPEAASDPPMLAYAAWLQSHRPFHWWVEFYAIVQQRGGFDVVIGNPPYLAASKVRPAYRVRGFRTARCANLYAFVIERALHLLRAGGRCGMIVPIASVSTEGMRELQALYRGLPQWHSHFAVRPGKLFDGVDMNLTITLLQHSPGHERRCVTGYRRWSNGTPTDRPLLFPTLAYTTYQLSGGHANPLPKLGTAIEVQILERMLAHGRTLGEYVVPNGTPIYYHSGGRYWRKALPVRLSSHYKPITVPRELSATVLALLNSQLFYWYWISNSNCMDVVAREVLALPVFPLTEADSAAFAALTRCLLETYAASSSQRRRRGARISGDEINFDVQHAKPIIDAIDLALARHYGFTEEELDFIINYDIKYRMGRAAEEP